MIIHTCIKIKNLHYAVPLSATYGLNMTYQKQKKHYDLQFNKQCIPDHNGSMHVKEAKAAQSNTRRH